MGVLDYLFADDEEELPRYTSRSEADAAMRREAALRRNASADVLDAARAAQTDNREILTTQNFPTRTAQRRAMTAAARNPAGVIDPDFAAELGMTPAEAGYAATHGGVPLDTLGEQRAAHFMERSADWERDIADSGRELPTSEAAVFSGFVPFEDELLALGEVADRPDLDLGDWRERQQHWEEQFAGATREAPASTMLGGLGLMLTTGRALGPGGVVPALREGQGIAQAARNAAPLAAGLGALGGVLGAAEADEGERVQGAALGGLQGATTGLLGGIPLAYAGRLATAAPVTIGGALSTAARQGMAEGLGQGALLGYEASGEQAGSLGRTLESLYAGGAGAIGGLLASPLSAGARYIGSMRAARDAARSGTPDVIPDEAPTMPNEAPTELGELGLPPQVDDAAAGAVLPMPETYPGEALSPREALIRSVSPSSADAARLRAAGALDRGQLRALESSFGTGRPALRRAVDALADANVTSPGEVVPTSELVRRAEAARDAARIRLQRGHTAATQSGATIPGGTVADALEAEARALETGSAPGSALERAAALRERATDIRYGNVTPDGRPLTPERAAYEQARRATEAAGRSIGAQPPPAPGTVAQLDAEGLVDTIPEVPATLIPETQFRAIPYPEARRTMQQIAEDAAFAKRNQQTATARARNLGAEYRALQEQRDAVLRQVLTPEEFANMQTANRAYRATASIVPDTALPIHDIASPGTLRAAGARLAGGGPADARGMIMGFLERAYTDVEPSVFAAIAETGLPTARESIGNAASAAIRSGAVSQLDAGAALALSRAARGGRLSAADTAAANAALDALLDSRPADRALLRSLQMHRNVRQWPAIMRAVAEVVGQESRGGPRLFDSPLSEQIAAALGTGVPMSAAVFQALMAGAPLGPQREMPLNDDSGTIDESIYGDELGNLPSDTGLYDPLIHGELEEEDR